MGSSQPHLVYLFPPLSYPKTLSLTTSSLPLSILVTPHILLRHFISATSSLPLSSTFIPQDSFSHHFIPHPIHPRNPTHASQTLHLSHIQLTSFLHFHTPRLFLSPLHSSPYPSS